jgi:hypothetical protein
MNETLHSCLVTSSQVSIPLQGVRIEACLMGLGSEVTVTQRYTSNASHHAFPFSSAANEENEGEGA